MRLANLTKDDMAKLFEAGKVVAIVPVGSVEPHGPHLPLGTDTIISERAADLAVTLLSAKGVTAVVAPSVPYGVTDFASGFAGAVSLSARALTAFLRALAESFFGAGFEHVCFVNNHLEPNQDQAVRAAIVGFHARASVACPLTKRHARTLSDEFKSGACHAGRYETSLVMASAGELVRADVAKSLPEVAISLSDGIRSGKRSFSAMGMTEAYAGAPALASEEEGRDLLGKLAEMVAMEVFEAMSLLESKI